MKTLRKLLAIRSDDVAAVWRAYYFLALAGWRLFVRNQPIAPWVITKDLASGSTDTPLTEREEQAVTRAARWVNAAARRPFPWARCLQRSLALCLLLQRQGFQPGIRIGVRKEGAGIEAHAWVEYKGRLLNDKEVVTAMFPKLSSTLEARVQTR